MIKIENKPLLSQPVLNKEIDDFKVSDDRLLKLFFSSRCNTNQIQQILPRLPVNAAIHVSDEHFSQLDLSKVEYECLLNLLGISISNFNLGTYSAGELKRRLSLLTTQQVQQILPRLPVNVAIHVSDEHFSQLDLSKVEYECLLNLLGISISNFNLGTYSAGELKRRLSLLTTQQVQQILPRLPVNVAIHVSDEHFSQLDLSKVEYECLLNLLGISISNFNLGTYSAGELKRRLSLLTTEQVQQILPRLPVNVAIHVSSKNSEATVPDNQQSIHIIRHNNQDKQQPICTKNLRQRAISRNKPMRLIEPFDIADGDNDHKHGLIQIVKDKFYHLFPFQSKPTYKRL